MDGGLPADQIIPAVLDAFCDWGIRCNALPIADKSVCLSLLEDSLAGGDSTFDSPQALVDSVAGGQVLYDPAAGAACVEAYRNRGCSYTIESPGRVAGCQGAFAGTVANGGSCIIDLACTGSQLCVAQPDGGPCAGACTAQNTPCEENQDCAVGQICLLSGTCVAFVPSTLGQSCDGRQTCDDNLLCEPADGGSVCVAAGQSGEPCQTFRERACASGLTCVPNPADGTATCLPARGVGESCQTLFQCGGQFSTAYCAPDAGVCAPLPVSGPCVMAPNLGGICNVLQAYCQPEDAGPGSCQTYLSLGAACSASAQCGPVFGRTTCDIGGDGGRVCQAPTVIQCTP